VSCPYLNSSKVSKPQRPMPLTSKPAPDNGAEVAADAADVSDVSDVCDLCSAAVLGDEVVLHFGKSDAPSADRAAISPRLVGSVSIDRAAAKVFLTRLQQLLTNTSQSNDADRTLR